MNARGRRLRWAAPIAAAISLASVPALADVTKEQCIDANGKAQDLRRGGKLSAAREQLRTCANASCPSMVRDDCTKRLDELEKAQPTIIFRAKDASGQDVSAVKVTVDGRPLADKLDGTALPVDPGDHVFTFTTADQPPVTKTFVIGSGEKERREPVIFGGAPASPTPAQPTAAVAPTPAAPTQAAPSRSAPDIGGASSPWKTVGWVVGGAGVVGLGVGAVFGVLTLGDKSSAHCGSDNLCDPGTSSGIKSAALISDLGWIAGGVLLASGAALVLFTPSGSRDGTAGVRVAPIVTASGGEVVVAGGW